MREAGDLACSWVVADDWVTSRDDDGRMLFAFPAKPIGLPRRITAPEIRQALGDRTCRQIMAVSAAGSAVLLHARGHALRGIEADPSGWRIMWDGSPGVTPAERTALAFAGPIAAQASLARNYLRDPLRIAACWILGGDGLVTLPQRFEPPTLLLCGEGAHAPHEWTGRALHAEHIHGEVQHFLEPNWRTVHALAESLVRRNRLTRRRIAALLRPDGANPVVGGPWHPMFQPTAIDPRAIEAAARYWAAQLRTCLDPGGQEHGAADGTPGQDRATPEMIEAFATAAAEEIGARIERRTPTSCGGLRRETSRRTCGAVYRVGVENQVVPNALSVALEAVGLPEGVLNGSAAPAVDLDPHGAYLDYPGPDAVLWRVQAQPDPANTALDDDAADPAFKRAREGKRS